MKKLALLGVMGVMSLFAASKAEAHSDRWWAEYCSVQPYNPQCAGFYPGRGPGWGRPDYGRGPGWRRPGFPGVPGFPGGPGYGRGPGWGRGGFPGFPGGPGRGWGRGPGRGWGR